MLKIKKGYNSGVIAIIMIVIFCLNSEVYGLDLSGKRTLRIFSMGNHKNGKERLEKF